MARTRVRLTAVLVVAVIVAASCDVGDFTGDDLPDPAIFDPATGVFAWADTTTSPAPVYSHVRGGAHATRDLPVGGDWLGDSRADFAIYRPPTIALGATGTYLVEENGDSGTLTLSGLGQIGDIPIVDDFDGDAKADAGYYRPSDGTWKILLSSEGYSATAPLEFTFGGPGQLPLTGDIYNVDEYALADVATYAPLTGTFQAWLMGAEGPQIELTSFVVSGGTNRVPWLGDINDDGEAELGAMGPAGGSLFRYGPYFDSQQSLSFDLDGTAPANRYFIPIPWTTWGFAAYRPPIDISSGTPKWLREPADPLFDGSPTGVPVHASLASWLSCRNPGVPPHIGTLGGAGGTRVSILGDSIAFRSCLAFQATLEDDYLVSTKGIIGAKIDDLGTGGRLYEAFDQYEGQGSSTAHVVINLGTNNVLYPDGQSIPSMITDLSYFVDQLAGSNGSGTCVHLVNINQKMDGDNDGQGDSAKAYNSLLAGAVSTLNSQTPSRQVRIIDWASAVAANASAGANEPKYFTAGDTVHPNHTGQVALAELIEDSIDDANTNGCTGVYPAQ